MIDSTVLGETAARCMESLDNHEALDGGAIEAVLIVVVARDEADTGTWTRVYSSRNRYFEQRGLIAVANDCIMEGEIPDGETEQ